MTDPPESTEKVPPGFTAELQAACQTIPRSPPLGSQIPAAPTTSGAPAKPTPIDLTTPMANNSAPEPEKQDPPKETPWHAKTREQKIEMAKASPAYSAEHVQPPNNYNLLNSKKAAGMKISAEGGHKYDLVICWLARQDKLTAINWTTVPAWDVSQVLNRICFNDGFYLITQCHHYHTLPYVSIC
jgi:hypothetical protein